jgi:hypothetical protein
VFPHEVNVSNKSARWACAHRHSSCGMSLKLDQTMHRWGLPHPPGITTLFLRLSFSNPSSEKPLALGH